MELAIDYWERLGFRIASATGDGFVATRGSLRGNLFSFDMSRVLAVVTVEFDPRGIARVETEIEPRFQKFTAADDMFFRFELVDFQSVVQSGKSLVNLWPPTSDSSSALLRLAYNSGIVGSKKRAWLAEHLTRLEAVGSFADFSPDRLESVDEPVSLLTRKLRSLYASLEDSALEPLRRSSAWRDGETRVFMIKAFVVFVLNLIVLNVTLYTLRTPWLLIETNALAGFILLPNRLLWRPSTGVAILLFFGASRALASGGDLAAVAVAVFLGGVLSVLGYVAGLYATVIAYMRFRSLGESSTEVLPTQQRVTAELALRADGHEVVDFWKR